MKTLLAASLLLLAACSTDVSRPRGGAGSHASGHSGRGTTCHCEQHEATRKHFLQFLMKEQDGERFSLTNAKRKKKEKELPSGASFSVDLWLLPKGKFEVHYREGTDAGFELLTGDWEAGDFDQILLEDLGYAEKAPGGVRVVFSRDIQSAGLQGRAVALDYLSQPLVP